MSNHELLEQCLAFEKAMSLQIKYSQLLEKEIPKIHDLMDLKKYKEIVGVDVSYYSEKNGEEWGVACAVSWDCDKNKMLSYEIARDRVTLPYKAGYLGFREVYLMAKAINKFDHEPELIMCDGHGIIHPKRFGEAVHLGVALNIPTFGVAKNPFIGYSEWSKLKRKRGEKTPVWTRNPDINSNVTNVILGQAICLTDNTKPVFISVGYKITLKMSVDMALQLTRGHRQPEPLYLADKLSRTKIKN